jgi:hypothetical protein
MIKNSGTSGGAYSEFMNKMLGSLGGAKITTPTPFPTDTEFLKRFDKELDLIILKEKTLGSAFNSTREQVNYFKYTLEALWDSGLRPGEDPLLDLLNKRMEALTLQAEIQDIVVAGFTRLFSATTEDMNNFGQFFKQWTQELLRAFQQMIARMLAEKIGLKIMGGMLGGIGSSATSATSGAIWQMGNVMGLGKAKGGTVPPGFPHDTYPALLSSGEDIIPAGKIFNGFNDRNSNGEVIFRIGQDELVGILKKANKQNSLY